MPFCIAQCTVIAARRVPGKRCRVISANEEAGRVFDFVGDASLQPGGDWTNYMRGVVAKYLDDLPGGQAGFDAAVVSTVPLGGGLSSSASLEVATATMLEAMYSLHVPPTEKALRCQACEHEFCGLQCGIMDQFVAACGQEGHALLIDCRRPFPTEHVPLDDPTLALLVANSNVKHKLSGSEYPERVQQCRDACAALRVSGHVRVQYLRDATLEQLSRLRGLPEAVLKRARHGVTEDVRTLQAKEALRAGEYARVGQLMLESHASLRDDYEVSTPELDALVEIAMGVDGVYGSRMTGGGFGGCTVTLLKASAVGAVLEAIEREDPKRTGGKKATCFSTTAGGGARVLQQGAGVCSSEPAWRRYALAAGALAIGAAFGFALRYRRR